MDKKCSHCHITKPLSNYYRNSKSLDGHDWWCKTCKSDKQPEWTRNHSPEKVKAYLKKKRLETKRMVMERYGGECVCCGESHLLFLSIDHIVNGSGSADRKLKSKGGKGGTQFYEWLLKNNCPTDNYQILCFNCNLAKGFYGKCPHNNIKS